MYTLRFSALTFDLANKLETEMYLISTLFFYWKSNYNLSLNLSLRA